VKQQPQKKSELATYMLKTSFIVLCGNFCGELAILKPGFDSPHANVPPKQVPRHPQLFCKGTVTATLALPKMIVIGLKEI